MYVSGRGRGVGVATCIDCAVYDPIIQYAIVVGGGCGMFAWKHGVLVGTGTKQQKHSKPAGCSAHAGKLPGPVGALACLGWVEVWVGACMRWVCSRSGENRDGREASGCLAHGRQLAGRCDVCGKCMSPARCATAVAEPGQTLLVGRGRAGPLCTVHRWYC